MLERQGLLTVATLWMVVVLAGCSGSEPERQTGRTTGTVTLNGAPITTGAVNFTAAGTGNAALAPLDSEGRFQINTMVTGTYSVTVTPPAPTPENPKPAAGPVEIPAKYRDASTSGLTAEVKSGNNHFDFKLDQ